MDDLVIVVAEDDAGHFELVRKNLWLSCVDKDIIHFTDGQQILDFLFQKGHGQHRINGQNYIILLDIRMPKVDGREVLKCIKNDPKLKKIPVIMLTTTDDNKEVDLCYDLGCSFYIVKPVDYSSFMEAVESLGKFLSLDQLKVPKV
jgi:CheY-like chemotaxis protein